MRISLPVHAKGRAFSVSRTRPNMGSMLANMRQAHHPVDQLSVHQPVDGHRTDVPHADQPQPLAVQDGDEAIKTHPESVAAQEIRLALSPIEQHMQHFKAAAEMLAHVMEQVAAAYKAPIWQAYTLSTTNHSYVVRDEKRGHLAAFVASAQSIQLLIPGVGAGISYNLVAGWNQLDFPPLTEITTTAANPFNVLFVYSIDRTANA